MVEKIQRIIVYCKQCHKKIIEMGFRLYYDTTLNDNFVHHLTMTCPFCRIVENYKDVFKYGKPRDVERNEYLVSTTKKEARRP